MLEALENLEEIVRLSDAVMVARGDLAVEIGQSRLPAVQKQIIKLCNQLNKPVITATQMLDSMVENPRPTRAEITDVANAVLDGTDATMLSAETASGKYPFKCIRTMHEIIRDVEQNQETYYKISLENEFLSVAGAVGASASLSALKLDAKVIVCLTTTGKTANIIAGFRPKARIIAVTDNLATLNRLEIIWGLQTLLIHSYKSMEDVVSEVERLLIQYGLAKTGDKIVFTLGTPISDGAKTNTLFIFALGGETLHKLEDLEIPLRCQQETEI
jgi:pyruvate kinase